METLISAVTKETRLYLVIAYEPFYLISCCWLLNKTLVITTNLTNPESASASLLIFGPCPHLFGTEDYVFQNRGDPCNYRVREEETKRPIFGLTCGGGRLCSFAGSSCLFVGSL